MGLALLAEHENVLATATVSLLNAAFRRWARPVPPALAFKSILTPT